MVDRGNPLFPETPRRRRVYRGLVTERQELIFHWIAVVVILVFTSLWVGAIAEERRQRLEEAAEEAAEARAIGLPAPPPTAAPPAPTPTQQMADAILDHDTPTTAFLNEAALSLVDPMRGQSGKVKFAPRLPGSQVAPNEPNGTQLVAGDSVTVPNKPGIYKLAVQFQQATKPIDDMSLITLVPLSQKRGGKIGFYYLGNWPWEKGGTPRAPAYAPPAGFIEVTPQNQNTYVSEHFRLRDFLTKDQPNVWPKYLLLNPKLIDKLELTIAELKAMGIRTDHVTIMSGFRTPQYNHTGGNTAGRANLSRHMYGDASDIFIDNDGNGSEDDLNRDGRVDERDADVVRQAAERVERKYPSLVGGIGVYSACCGHGPFTHIDVRGFRARWRGTGNG